jgi:hypothetical protein
MLGVLVGPLFRCGKTPSSAGVCRPSPVFRCISRVLCGFRGSNREHQQSGTVDFVTVV